jgi:hypothetical protein
MRRVFRTKTFTRWMQKTGLTDYALCQAVSEMANGLVDAELGGNVVKKRVALPGQGKRSGARTIVATKLAERWFFLYGFSKNERANIDQEELKALQELATTYLSLDDKQIELFIHGGKITEINDD